MSGGNIQGDVPYTHCADVEVGGASPGVELSATSCVVNLPSGNKVRDNNVAPSVLGRCGCHGESGRVAPPHPP